MTASENDILWYVFNVSFKKELEVRDELRQLGYDAYVPMHFRLLTIHGRQVRKQEPAVFGMVFVKGARKKLLEYRDRSKLKCYMFLKSSRTTENKLEYVCVRETDMENFRKLNEVEGAQLKYYKPEELRLAKGEKVKIMDGPFEGITGIIQKLPHRRGQFLIVSLPNIAIATVSIKPEYIQPLSRKIEKSSDVEKDSKLMAKLALKIITDNDLPNKTVVLNEIDDIRESLKGCKVFLANDRANYYFAFYAAALAMKEPSDEYVKKLIEVLPRLKANNLLKPTADLLFYYQTKDIKYYDKASEVICKWDATKYSEPQKSVIKLQRALRHLQSVSKAAGQAEKSDASNNKRT